MIVRPRPKIFKLFFVMNGSIVPRILPQIFSFALYGVGVVALVNYFRLDMSAFTIAPFGLLGITLSIYLGFRNNAAYERWWDARKYWGELIFGIRNLARAADTLIADRDARRALLMDALAFCHLLRGQLRNVDAMPEAQRFLDGDAERIAGAANRADAVVRLMGRRVGAEYAGGRLDTMGFRILDERLAGFSALQAGCEKINTTPLPFAYTLLLLRTTYIACLLLPVALAATTGWATPFFTALFAYTFFGLDALSEELEDPFGTESNDLALDAMCRICEISVFEALDEVPPAPLQPVRYYQS